MHVGRSDIADHDEVDVAARRDGSRSKGPVHEGPFDRSSLALKGLAQGLNDTAQLQNQHAEISDGGGAGSGLVIYAPPVAFPNDQAELRQGEEFSADGRRREVEPTGKFTNVEPARGAEEQRLEDLGTALRTQEPSEQGTSSRAAFRSGLLYTHCALQHTVCVQRQSRSRDPRPTRSS